MIGSPGIASAHFALLHSKVDKRAAHEEVLDKINAAEATDGTIAKDNLNDTGKIPVSHLRVDIQIRKPKTKFCSGELKMSGNVDSLSMYRAIMSYFIDRSERDSVVISPNFGQELSAITFGSLYFEYYGERIFNIQALNDDQEEDFYVDNFNISGRPTDMLVVSVHNNFSTIPRLWDIRLVWMTTGGLPS